MANMFYMDRYTSYTNPSKSLLLLFDYLPSRKFLEHTEAKITDF